MAKMWCKQNILKIKEIDKSDKFKVYEHFYNKYIIFNVTEHIYYKTSAKNLMNKLILDFIKKNI